MLVAARTHDYGKQPVDHLAKLLKSEGIEAAQLVLPKAFSEINSYEEVTPQLVEQIRKNFEEENIKIQILGCYMDLGNPDDEVRKNAVDTFKKCLKFNQILGASIVGTETAYPRLSLVKECQEADIIIAALGQPNFVKEEMVKEGAVVIDVGTTRVPDASKKSGFKLTGDVKFDEVAPKCSFITPVPGGVGPMTIVSLMKNTLLAGKKAIYK